jgi:hypothetical protein
VSWTEIIKPDSTVSNSEDGVSTGIIKKNNKLIIILDFEKIVTDISPETGLRVEEIRELGERQRNDVPVLMAEDSALLNKLISDSLKEAGYNNIYVIGNKEGQKKRAESLGIDRYICSTDDISEAYDSFGIFECVGKADTIALAIDMAGAFGRVTLVGNPYGDVELERDLYWKILRNQLTITGVWNSRFNGQSDDDWHYVLDRISSGSIVPESLITHKFPLKDLMSGLSIMKDKTEDYVKIMTVTDCR